MMYFVQCVFLCRRDIISENQATKLVVPHSTFNQHKFLSEYFSYTKPFVWGKLFEAKKKQKNNTTHDFVA